MPQPRKDDLLRSSSTNRLKLDSLLDKLDWTEPSKWELLKNNDSEPVSPEDYGKPSRYNTRALVGNWYEERRQYHNLSPRCTGHSIFKTDYQPYEEIDYNSCKTFPPSKYAHALVAEGLGHDLLRNEGYCPYLTNYTTTYDLMHNWEVRRAGIENVPSRKWRMSNDGKWFPDRDNALPFGNLTQISFRNAPPLPVLPRDWDNYCNVSTEYRDRYLKPDFPSSYTLARRAYPKCITRANEDILFVKKPDLSDKDCDDLKDNPDNESQFQCCNPCNSPKANCRTTNPPRFKDDNKILLRELRSQHNPNADVNCVLGPEARELASDYRKTIQAKFHCPVMMIKSCK